MSFSPKICAKFAYPPPNPLVSHLFKWDNVGIKGMIKIVQFAFKKCTDPFSHVMFVWQITHRSLLEEDKSDLNPWPFPPGNHGANPLRKDDRLSAPTHMQSGARGQSIVIDFWRWVGGRRRENSEGKKSKNLLFPKIFPSCVRDVSGENFRNLSLLTCLSLIFFFPPTTFPSPFSFRKRAECKLMNVISTFVSLVAVRPGSKNHSRKTNRGHWPMVGIVHCPT